jgi:heme-degrading monooxygenase HmoA
MSHLRIPTTRVDEVVSAFRARAHLVDQAEGFIDLQVWRSDRDPEALIMVSRWESRRAFTAYMRSEAHRLSHARIDPSLDEVIRLQRLDHLHTYEVVAE